MAKLHIDSYGKPGTRPEIVMIHGWAMHGGLMTSMAQQLAQHHRVHVIDMPGHGNSDALEHEFTLENVADAVWQGIDKLIDGKPVMIGWSLGGMVATKIAESHADDLSALVLIASNPSFVKHSDWQYGIEQEVLQGFATELQQDIKTTLTRFLTLQVRGSTDSRQVLKQLRQQLFTRNTADAEVLLSGLNILEQDNLREVFNQLALPILLLAGERDTLVPESAIQALDAINDNVKSVIIKKAGHAPFLSHQAESVEAITEFLS